MNKKTLIAIVVALVLVVGGVAVWAAVNNVEETDSRQSEQSATESEEREQAVIEEAKRFTPPAGTACTTVMTPARHVETGVTYTFSSGCLPDGWERLPQSTVPTDPENSDAAAAPGTDDGNRQSAPQSNASPGATSDVTADRMTAERARALREAEKYQPPAGTHCTTVMTPARHIQTGATYTFTSGCIPDGWERIDSNSPRARQ